MVIKTLLVLAVTICCVQAQCQQNLKVPLYRYYNGKITDHFYTINFNEIGHGKHGYKLEKVECKVWSYAQPGTVPLYRYWNGRDHFYTTSASEIGTTIPGTTGNHGYKSEGVEGFCYPMHITGTIPLYRYWNSKVVNHFYTTSITEIGTATPGTVGKHGYVSEGVACYVFPARC